MFTSKSWAFFICDTGIAEPLVRIKEVHDSFCVCDERRK